MKGTNILLFHSTKKEKVMKRIVFIMVALMVMVSISANAKTLIIKKSKNMSIIEILNPVTDDNIYGLIIAGKPIGTLCIFTDSKQIDYMHFGMVLENKTINFNDNGLCNILFRLDKYPAGQVIFKQVPQQGYDTGDLPHNILLAMVTHPLHVLRFQVPIYEGGDQIFTFNITNFIPMYNLLVKKANYHQIN